MIAIKTTDFFIIEGFFLIKYSPHKPQYKFPKLSFL